MSLFSLFYGNASAHILNIIYLNAFNNHNIQASSFLYESNYIYLYQEKQITRKRIYYRKSFLSLFLITSTIFA